MSQNLDFNDTGKPLVTRGDLTYIGELGPEQTKEQYHRGPKLSPGPWIIGRL